MHTLKLVAAPAAKADLKEIYRYGLRHWGQKQSDSYIEKLKTHFWSLVEQPATGIERPELLSNIRSFPIESHTVFYRITTETVEIVRVLHGRQDPHRHVK